MASYPMIDETVLMMGHKICFNREIWLIIPKVSGAGLEKLTNANRSSRFTNNPQFP